MPSYSRRPLKITRFGSFGAIAALKRSPGPSSLSNEYDIAVQRLLKDLTTFTTVSTLRLDEALNGNHCLLDEEKSYLEIYDELSPILKAFMKNFPIKLCPACVNMYARLISSDSVIKMYIAAFSGKFHNLFSDLNRIQVVNEWRKLNEQASQD